MRRTRTTALALAALLTVAACGTETGAPGAGDDATTGTDDEATAPDDGEGTAGPDDEADEDGEVLADTRGEGDFLIDNVSVRQAESHPVQLFLDVDGNAPTPCHTVAYEVDDEDENEDGNDEATIRVHLTTVVQTDTMCTQVLVPHEISVPLGHVEDFPVTVDVNDGEHILTVDG